MWVCVCVFACWVSHKCSHGVWMSPISTRVMWASTLPPCWWLPANAPTWRRVNMFICCVNNSRAEFIPTCEHAELISQTMCGSKMSQQVQELWNNEGLWGRGGNLILWSYSILHWKYSFALWCTNVESQNPDVKDLHVYTPVSLSITNMKFDYYFLFFE